jgi:antitoxin (DNA-binding transcriptional repressor) of toxin-antitoxin stability system
MATITLKELHDHTDEWVLKNEEVQILSNGEVVATIVPTPREPKVNPWATRKLLPGFEAIMNKPVGGMDSADMISEDRDAR